MIKLFHTVVTTQRHRELGYCEDSDFGTIDLVELPLTEKKLIVSFQVYETKKEFIEFEGYAYAKLNSESNLGGMSREDEAVWVAKQGRFSRDSAVKLALKIRERFDNHYSFAPSSHFLLVEKTLYVRYCEIEHLSITICGNMLFAHWISINIENHSGKRIEKLNKENFDRIVKTEYKEWMKGNPNTKSIDGKTHSCFSKPTNVKWGDDYLN